jgi:hypothetical protein
MTTFLLTVSTHTELILLMKFIKEHNGMNLETVNHYSAPEQINDDNSDNTRELIFYAAKERCVSSDMLKMLDLEEVSDLIIDENLPCSVFYDDLRYLISRSREEKWCLKDAIHLEKTMLEHPVE